MKSVYNKLFPVYLSVCLTVLSLAANAQQFKISGMVNDISGHPVSQAKIILLSNTTSKQIATATTAANGSFVISSIDTGWYQLSITHPFYISRKDAIHLRNTDLSLDTIRLAAPVVTLKDITVESRKKNIEQKIDRTIFNVENNVSLDGASALDAVGKVPGVRLRGSNGIILTGRGQLNVLIDDRIVRMSGDDLINMLKSIPASSILRIELIPVPPAKYDAEGSNGLINIVTKRKRENGVTGSVNAAASQAYYLSGNGSGLLDYNKNKISLSTMLSVSNNVYREYTNPITYFPDQTWDQERVSKNITRGLLAKAGLDYKISKHSLLGIIYTYANKDATAAESSGTSIYQQTAKTIDSTVNARNDITRNTQSHDFVLHFESLLDSTGKKFSLDGGYFTFHNSLTQFSDSRSFVDGTTPGNVTMLNSRAPQNVNAFTLQTDVTLPSKKINLSFGGKVSFIRTNSGAAYFRVENGETRYDSALSNVFNYQENIQALYFNTNKQWKKWGMQLGLRGEYTQTTGRSVTYDQTTRNSYFKLFPTIFLSYKQNGNNSFFLSYSKRINRPNYWYLNPFKQYVSPYYYFEGNPFLRPAFNNNFEFRYSLKNNFITKAFMLLGNNVYDQILLTDTVTKIRRLTRMNYYSQRTYGLSQTVSLPGIKWLENYNTASLYYIDTRSSVDYVPGRKGWGADLSSSNTFIFNAKNTFSGSLDFSYTFPQLSGIYKFRSYYSVDLGCRMLFMDKKLSVSVNATDIFRTSKTRFYSLIDNITTYYNNYFDNRTVRVSVGYKFGKNPKPRRQVKASNSDEKNRTY